MSRTLFVLALLAGAAIASADTLTVTGAITLDNSQPTYNGYDYSWKYTVSTSCTGYYCFSDLAEINSIEIFGVGGVTSVVAPTNWDASYAPDGGGYDVTFTSNYAWYDRPGRSLDGFYIDSHFSTATNANYTVDLNYQSYDPVVGAPGMATPEPASLGLTGLALVALGAFKRRKR